MTGCCCCWCLPSPAPARAACLLVLPAPSHLPPHRACRQRVWGLDWIAAPPPSSAMTVLAALQILAGEAGLMRLRPACWLHRLETPPATCLLAPFTPQRAGFEQPLAGAGSLGVHRLVESLKHAFALRMNLGGRGGGASGGRAPLLPSRARCLPPSTPRTHRLLLHCSPHRAGDPGPDPDHPFVDLTAILSALNTSEFISSLRCACWCVAGAPHGCGGRVHFGAAAHARPSPRPPRSSPALKLSTAARCPWRPMAAPST